MGISKRASRIMESNKCILIYKNDKNIHFKFRYFVEELEVQKLFTLQRSEDETVKSLCRRIGLNLLNKKGARSQEPPPIYFTNGKERVSDDMPLSGLLKGSFFLCIGKTSYELLLNPSEVTKVTLPKIILVGFTVIPLIEYTNCDSSSCKFSWYKSKDKTSEDLNSWTKISDQYLYVPTEKDRGYYLRLDCVPSDRAEAIFGAFSISAHRVKHKASCIFQHRPCTDASVGDFKCLSYNILADQYCDPDVKGRVTQFPYCPKEALKFDYRKVLLLEELMFYKSDLYCLQEVDKDFFSKELTALFAHKNFEALFDEKSGKAEGLVTAFNKEKFKLIKRHIITYAEELKLNPLFADLKEYVSINNSTLFEKITGLGTILQVVELQFLGSDFRLLVANTHLYYAPKATILRLLQAYIGIRYIEKILEQRQDSKCSFLWCGDFNSAPQYATYHFLSTGELSSSHPDWAANEEFPLPGLDLKHCLPLKSAYGTPEFTNFTKDFVACLDYILYDSKLLRLANTVPIPGREVVSKNKALPSFEHPSDHIALIATFSLK